MSWAAHHIRLLREGQTIQFRPRGNSMQGRIESGSLVTMEPLGEKPPEVGEAVLCTVAGTHYLHLVKAVQGDRVLIGNNHGKINGWTNMRRVYGRVVRVEP